MVSNKKRVVKKKSTTKSRSKSPEESRGKFFSKPKLLVVSRNLIFFILLSVIFYVLFLVSVGEFFNNVFHLLFIVFAFISLAFFISLLVLLLLKWLRR